MHAHRFSWRWPLGTALVAVAACATKTVYIPQEPLHEKAPPAWVAVPARFTKEGFEVTGWSDNRDLTMASRLAETEARLRALGIFEEVLRSSTKEHRFTAADEAILSDVRASVSSERRGNMAGFVPVAQWYDPAARRQYALVRMPKERFDRLFELYGRAQVLDALRKVDVELDDDAGSPAPRPGEH